MGTPNEQVQLWLFAHNKQATGHIRFHSLPISPKELAREIVSAGGGFAGFTDLSPEMSGMDAATLHAHLQANPYDLLNLAHSLELYNGCLSGGQPTQSGRASDVKRQLGFYAKA
jgi:hypothetical protein